FAGRDYVDFVDKYFKVDVFERTYARGIRAMSTVIVTEDDNLPDVGPPNTRHIGTARKGNLDIMRRHAESLWRNSEVDVEIVSTLTLFLN
ncbi:hypothetical protein V1515DRAFT_609351, partial [Lipomyces mesembrius]